MDKGFDVVSSLYREGSNLTMKFCSENLNLIFWSSSFVIIVLVTVTWPDVAGERMSRSLFGTSGFRFLFGALSRRDCPSKQLPLRLKLGHNRFILLSIPRVSSVKTHLIYCQLKWRHVSTQGVIIRPIIEPCLRYIE
jgi:hypothetical protein